MELFKAEKIRFRFPDYRNDTYEKQPYLLEDVSFTIEKGDFIILAGATGCGKSTLLRLLKKELTPRGERTGKILFYGKELGEYKDGELTSRIGFVMQSPEHQCVTDKVWHELAFALENMGLCQQEMRFRCAEMASYFGMDEWLDKEVQTLSGGQKQLLNLASVLVMRPEILILDEPTSQLDPIAAENFIQTVKKLNEETGITILMAEHRLESVLPLADKVLLMDRGRIVYEDKPEYMTPKMPSFELFKRALPCSMRLFFEGKKEENTSVCPLTVAQGRRYLEEYFSKNVLRKQDITDCFPESIKNTHRTLCLELKSIWFKYSKKGVDVLKDTNLQLYEGEIMCLLGANGSGKSTALKCAAGILKPYAGKVKGKDRNIAYLPQDVETVFVTDLVEDDLKLVGYDMENNEFPFKLSPLYKKHPYDLSGGEKQIVAIAKVLAKGADVLLLDEPAKGLDINAKFQLLELLQLLKKKGKTILLVTHDVEFAALCSDRCALFYRGEVVSSQSERSFFSRNAFYTTAASRISRGFYDNIVTTQELLLVCREMGGGKY